MTFASFVKRNPNENISKTFTKTHFCHIEPLKGRLDSSVSPDLRHHLGQVRRHLDVLDQRVREGGPLLQNFVELVSVVSGLLRFELNVWKKLIADL
jgi:hypothetical protein